MSLPRSSLVALAVVLAGLPLGCQRSDEHPPFAAGCEDNCPLLPGIGVGMGSAGASSMNPDSDAGTGTLQGQVLLLTDDSFVSARLYNSGATVTADGASGSPVSGNWNGADPFMLDGVTRAATNWVSVKPDLIGGDPLLTYQAVRTNQVTKSDLALVSAATLDAIFTSVSMLRSANSGQVVLFFRSAGTGVPLSGLRVTMASAQAAIYSGATRWVSDDGTAITDQSGLIVFANVDPPNSGGTQVVTVTRAATTTTPAAAAGEFAVKVVPGAATIATIGVQL